MTSGSEFLLDAPADLQDYFREIAARMVLTFDIQRAEAVARINRHWRGQTFDERKDPPANNLVVPAPTHRGRRHSTRPDYSAAGPNDLVLHASPDYWASVIYFEEVFEDGQLRRVARPAPPPDSECWTLS